MKRSELSRTSHWLFSRRGPLFLDRIVRLGDQSIRRISPYVGKGQVVADLGCGWGHYSYALADLVGTEGKIFAVDLAPKVISKIRRKSMMHGYQNIETHATSAANLNFIQDHSVDFVFSNGLLCSMAVDRESAVSEIKRILKSTGYAYISLGATPPMAYVDKAESEHILQGFNVEKGGSFQEKWVLVSLKQGRNEYNL